MIEIVFMWPPWFADDGMPSWGIARRLPCSIVGMREVYHVQLWARVHAHMLEVLTVDGGREGQLQLGKGGWDMSKWIPCGEHFIVGDVIRWREIVWKEKRSP